MDLRPAKPGAVNLLYFTDDMGSTEYMALNFNEIVDQYYSSLCFFAERTLRERHPAEEIVQDVFVKYWQLQERFGHPKEVRKFLYLSVRNASLNYLRDGRVRAARQNDFLQQAPVTEDDVTRNIIEAEVWREISLAMNNLPEQCGRVIRMSFEQGLSTAEIAQAMGVAESTVRNQKARGISLLRKMLSHKAYTVLLLFL